MHVEARRERLRAICLSWPEATCRDGQHLKFEVRGRSFAYYLNDHHGDGKIVVECRVGPGENDMLARAEPDRYYIPSYLGPRGWVALRLDLPEVDWGEVTALAKGSYKLMAPKRLAAQVQ